MNLFRAIIVHALAVSLLWFGVCPCLAGNSACGSGDTKGEQLDGCVQAAGCKAQKSGGKPCCCCTQGTKFGAVCCCGASADRQPAAPAAPTQDSIQDHEQVVCAFVDLPTLLMAADAATLFRYSAAAGHGFQPVCTLQSQSVRIQT